MNVGNYELLTRLAHGGMAEAHVARSLVDGSIAVVKQLLPKYVGEPDFVEMFLDEGRVISSLNHPNVVAMKEFGFHNQLPYLAMEYLHGVNLRTLSRTQSLRGRQFPLSAAFFIVEAMLAGLEHAHEARTIDGRPMEITHRDVSPHNVVVTFDGEVKLIDFGIAKARGKSNETRSGALKGKVPYMAPEQVRSTTVDRRTDVYAAGVVLYELVVGKRPYVGNSPKLNEFNLMMAIANHQILAPRAVQPSVPPALDQAIMRALAAAPERRFQTAEEMRSALRNIGAQLGIAGSANQLSELMVATLGKRKPYAEALKSDTGVIELVTELERSKTIMDERSDPNLYEPQQPSLAMQSSGDGEQTEALSEDAVGEPDSGSLKAVDKVVEANRTRLTFRRPIDPRFRWGRLLDGIEGVVEIEFADPELTGTALTAAVEALRNLGSEVSELRLVSAPIALAAQLEARATIASVAVRGRCPICRLSQTVISNYAELRRKIEKGAPIQCPTCTRALVDIVHDVTFPSELAQPSPLTTVSSAPRPGDPVPPELSTASSTPNAPRVVQPVHAIGPTSHVLKRAPIYAAAVAVVSAIAGSVAWRAKSSPQPPSTLVLPSARIHLDQDRWVVELDRADDAINAKLVATRAVIAELETMLPAKLRKWSGSVGDIEAVANLRAQLTGIVDLEPRPGNPSRNGEYVVPASALASAVEHYSAIRTAWGLELANAPPTRATGVLVISAPAQSPIAAGDRVLTAGGHSVRSVQTLSEQQLQLPQLELVVEHREQRKLYVRNASD